MGHQNKILIFILLALYVLVVIFIGLRSRKSSSSEDYFLASRSLPPWLLSITFIASWWGGGSAIDLVNHANQDGLSSFWIYGVPVLIATALMYIFAGAIRRISTISQPELIEQRYDNRSSAMLTLFIIVFMTIGAATQVIVIAQFFQTFFAVDYPLGAAIGTSLVLFYSLFGGFRGVVLTDLFQFVFFLLASIFIFYLSYKGSGGFETLGSHLKMVDREYITSFFYKLDDNLAYVITFGTSWMIQANVWQRISAAPTPKAAKKMMGISFFVFIPLYLMVTLTGMLSIPIFDSIPEGGIVAALLLQVENPIVSAIIFLGLCSAIMSTMDSMLNTGALSATIDIYKRYIRPDESAAKYVNIGRISTIIIAAIALFIALRIKSIVTISWIGADFIATGAFVPLVLAFLWKRGTATASFCSMLFGLIFSTYNMFAALGANIPIWWEIASPLQAIIGICSSLLIFVVVSYFTKGDNKKAKEFIEKAGIIRFNS
ncbi:MAG: sodium:solute symporter family protein [Rikenellaceae bacterium]